MEMGHYEMWSSSYVVLNAIMEAQHLKLKMEGMEVSFQV